ncbi:hypothetical protein T484DRAFT_3631609 [Baffinella frigidus]|nr:hypothetical protein T484DRAFT_3631609 [Cryptophyta sp. CCMP2293]
MSNDARYDLLLDRVGKMRELCGTGRDLDAEREVVDRFEEVLLRARSSDLESRDHLERRVAKLKTLAAGDHAFSSSAVDAPRVMPFRLGSWLSELASPSHRLCPFPTLTDPAYNFAIEDDRSAWLLDIEPRAPKSPHHHPTVFKPRAAPKSRPGRPADVWPPQSGVVAANHVVETRTGREDPSFVQTPMPRVVPEASGASCDPSMRGGVDCQ